MFERMVRQKKLFRNIIIYQKTMMMIAIIVIFCRYLGDTKVERKQSTFYSQSCNAPNPIITVTEHTPTPSPDYMKRHVS